MSIIAKCSQQTDDTKHQHFDAAVWINLFITKFLIDLVGYLKQVYI
jgi:hypothetical protein